MTDVADIQPLMERAEQAAHRGDFVAAEEALRLAVELQERTLGALSPEVASTLNNLAIVYERLDRPADAEACFRRSFAIAKATFGHDHPLVETSATNLRDFCAARGIPFEQPEPAPVTARAESQDRATPSPRPRETSPAPLAATSSGSSRGPIVIGAVIVVAAAIFFSSRRATPPVASPPPTVAAAPAAPAVEPEKAAPAPAAPATAPPATASKPVSTPLAAPAPSKAVPGVAVVETLDARLCQSLDVQANWRCDPLPESAITGPVFFVTRLKVDTDTSVEHRWYRNDRLSQSVSLHVVATASGYRTYSRMTASPDRAGTWRVELRDAGGAVLDRKTFVVGPS